MKGKAQYVDLALLIAEGYVDAQRNGQAIRHRSIKPYRVPVSQPCPGHGPPTPRRRTVSRAVGGRMTTARCPTAGERAPASRYEVKA